MHFDFTDIQRSIIQNPYAWTNLECFFFFFFWHFELQMYIWYSFKRYNLGFILKWIIIKCTYRFSISLQYLYPQVNGFVLLWEDGLLSCLFTSFYQINRLEICAPNFWYFKSTYLKYFYKRLNFRYIIF